MADSRSQSQLSIKPRRLSMAQCKVLANDNAHYMDITEVSEHGIFSSAEQAVAACKKIVDNDLNSMWQPGATAACTVPTLCVSRARPFRHPHRSGRSLVEFGLELCRTTLPVSHCCEHIWDNKREFHQVSKPIHSRLLVRAPQISAHSRATWWGCPAIL
jgi:hypothetical protein